MTQWESHFRNRYNFTGLQDKKVNVRRILLLLSTLFFYSWVILLFARIEFPEMVEVSEDNFQFRYNLEDGDYSEYSVWWAGSGGDADEICLIKAEDTQKVKKAVEERIESQKGVFKDYVKEQYDKLCDAEINTKGNYVYWICTNDNKKAENIILSYFE